MPSVVGPCGEHTSLREALLTLTLGSLAATVSEVEWKASWAPDWANLWKRSMLCWGSWKLVLGRHLRQICNEETVLSNTDRKRAGGSIG